MAEPASVEFIGWDAIESVAREQGSATLVVFAGRELAMNPAVVTLLGPVLEKIRSSAPLARFHGRIGSVLELYGPEGLAFPRLLVVGASPKAQEGGGAPAEPDYASLGGFVAGKAGAGRVCVAFALPFEVEDADRAAADLSLGMRLRAYKFDRYKSRKGKSDEKDERDDKEGNETDQPTRVAIATRAAPSDGAVRSATALAEGVLLARDLVNEPANVLFPEEFAARAAGLTAHGITVDVLDEAALDAIGMRMLLAVGRGSRRESRVVLMRWNGADPQEKPLAFVGKGVCFDSGGISIKPAGGMEDMKGDMAGAACVVGLMRTLATRRARVNAIGAIGLVENMPDGQAQRPGDIVASLSGQTVEIVNTDAEGRLVLGDLLWHVRERFAPRLMVDLATLTGAILVALGSEHAGLFSNDDELAERLTQAGAAVGEKVWRMPLAPAYDKLLDSKFADMKNVGGRHAGSITAAHFLKRFVKDTPWAHLDIAGTAMSSPQTDVNQSWASGWGVRLLDRFVATFYET